MALPQQQQQHISEADYLAFEEESEIRHEYADGELIRMAGTTEEHNIIASNLNAELNIKLRGKPCRVYPADMRVQIVKQTRNTYRYPDIVVVCGERNFTESKSKKSVTLTNPTVLIEILSDGTASVDTIQKLGEYRKVESLQAYVIIAQDSPRIVKYYRTNTGWEDAIYIGLEATLELPSIDCAVKLRDIYYNLDFEDDPEEE